MAPFAFTQFDIFVHKQANNTALVLLIGLALLLSIGGLGYYADQAKFMGIVAFYLPAFACYFWVLKVGTKAANFKHWIAIALLARVLLVFAFPNLSDDIYRFIWDGRLWLAGENPFDQLPGYWLEKGNIPGLDQSLFDQLNSQAYFTIYPPICQFIFTTGTFLSPNSIWGASLVMKFFLLAFEIGSIFLIIDILKRLNLPKHRVFLYALNPLVIVEICGNLHFEGAMIFFFLLGVLLLLRKKDSWAALSIACSIAAKLLPLMLLPLLIKLMGWKRVLKFFLILFVCLVLLFIPLVSDVFLNNFGASLDLYFQKFEFNASIYYLVRAIGQWLSGYNLIYYLGPALAGLAALLIFRLAYLARANDYQHFFTLALLAFCTYLFLGTTIHPWYLALPIALSCFGNFRFIYGWSLLIFGTYMNYHFVPYQEQLWWVAIEYCLVFGCFYWEWKRRAPIELRRSQG